MLNPLDFFADYTYAQSMYGTVLVGVLAGALGPLVFLQRQSLVADVISHASLPGVMLAFLAATVLGYSGRNPVALLLGATILGYLALHTMNSLSLHPKISTDAAMAATVSTFFSLGMLVLQYVSRRPFPEKAGIQDYLLGNASTLTASDVRSIVVIGGSALQVLSLVHSQLVTSVFDANFSLTQGLPLATYRVLGMAALVAVTVVGIKVVGIVLMVAVLICPAIVSQAITSRLVPFIACSALTGAFTSAAGCYAAVTIGHVPTGPAIVIVQALAAVAALFIPWLVRKKRA